MTKGSHSSKPAVRRAREKSRARGQLSNSITIEQLRLLDGRRISVRGVRQDRVGKYNARATKIDGIRFASTREATRYCMLCELKRIGYVDWFTMQMPFYLPAGVKYLADFFVKWKPGARLSLGLESEGPDCAEYSVEDAKGARTPVYELKRKQVQELYGIKIHEV